MEAKSSSQMDPFLYPMFANWARVKLMLARLKIFTETAKIAKNAKKHRMQGMQRMQWM